MKTFLFTALTVLVASGCSTTYVPSPGTPDIKQIPSSLSGTRVAVVNAQPSTDILLLGKNGPSTYYANLHVWTERLVISLKETMKKKKITVDDHAPKALKVSIEKATARSTGGGWAFQCDLEWRVELSDGTVLPMSLEQGHWKIEDASNVAVRKACLMTLTNETVKRFLNGP